MHKRITIKDIAKELNLHHSTVSRALRNDPRIKLETQKKIVDYADENGYYVNMSALHLRGMIKNVIAIIVPNINHRFFSEIISNLTNIANENGFVMSIFQSNESLVEEKKIIKTIIKNNYAGVIASLSMETKNGLHFMELSKYHIPLVLFDRVCDINVSKVVVDNFGIISKAVNLLCQKGYKRIAYISGPEK